MFKFAKSTVISARLSAALLTAAVATAALSGVTAPALAAQSGMASQSGAADQAFPGLKVYYNMPASQRSQLGVYYIVKIKHVDPSQVQIVLHDGRNNIPLRIESGGRISPMPTREQLNRGDTITISGPADGSYAIKIRPYSTQAPSKLYDAGGLVTGIRQSNSAMSQAAGILAMALPKIDRVYFVGGGDATAVMANGREVPLPETESQGDYPAETPYFVPAEMSGAVKIKLSATPVVALYGNRPK